MEVEEKIEDIILNNKELDIEPIGNKIGKVIIEENGSRGLYKLFNFYC